MGLDVYVYENLEIVADTYDEDKIWVPGAGMEWSESIWPGRGEGVNPKSRYTWKGYFTFQAGSYHGYNTWREELSKFSESCALGTFNELIQFADNEGVIGPVVSKKLADDFQKNEQEALKFSESLSDPEWWFSLYIIWKEAFESASNNGAIEFG